MAEPLARASSPPPALSTPTIAIAAILMTILPVSTRPLRTPDQPTFVTPKNNLAANHWYSRDLPAMARALGVTSPAPVTLMAETSTNPEWKALDPTPLPPEISNRHFEYALTWFGLAAALACVYAATLWKRWRG